MGLPGAGGWYSSTFMISGSSDLRVRKAGIATTDDASVVFKKCLLSIPDVLGHDLWRSYIAEKGYSLPVLPSRLSAPVPAFVRTSNCPAGVSRLASG